MLEDACDGLFCNVAEMAVLGHHVLTVFHYLEVDMKSASRFACGDLGGEGHVVPFLRSERADDPFGDHKIVGSL